MQPLEFTWISRICIETLFNIAYSKLSEFNWIKHVSFLWWRYSVRNMKMWSRSGVSVSIQPWSWTQFIEIEKWEELRLRQGVSNNFISCGQLTQILHEHYYWNPFVILLVFKFRLIQYKCDLDLYQAISHKAVIALQWCFTYLSGLNQFPGAVFDTFYPSTTPVEKATMEVETTKYCSDQN